MSTPSLVSALLSASLRIFSFALLSKYLLNIWQSRAPLLGCPYRISNQTCVSSISTNKTKRVGSLSPYSYKPKNVRFCEYIEARTLAVFVQALISSHNDDIKSDSKNI